MLKKQVFVTAFVAFIVTCATYFMINQLAPSVVQAQPSDGFYNRLTVRELHVIGKGDTGRMVLKTMDGRPIMFFKTDEKAIRGQIGIANDNGFGLGCFDKNGNVVLTLCEKGDGILMLGMNPDGKEFGTALVVKRGIAGLRLASGNTKSAIGIFAKPEHAGISIQDKNGRNRCSMQHKDKYGSALGLSDGLGVDRFVAAVTDQGQNKIVLSKTGTKEVFSAIVHKNGSEMRLANSGVTGGPSFNLQYKDNTPLMRMINGNGDEIWASPSFQNQPPIVVTKKGKRVWEVPKR